MSERFERIYRAHAQAVYRYALRCVGRREVAEDLASEAFVEFLRRDEAIAEEHLLGWLLTVVRNRARDRWRHEVVEKRYLETLASRPAIAPKEAPSPLFEARVLKPVHRVCLHLRYVEGMTRAEVAAATGMTEIQVKGYLQYALQRLRASLTGRK